MAIRMDGKKIAAEIRGELKGRVEALKARGIEPCLAVILAGDDPASKIYVRNKKRACEEIGIRSLEILLPESVTEQELIEKIRELNEDKSVHAMLVQLPFGKKVTSDQYGLQVRCSGSNASLVLQKLCALQLPTNRSSGTNGRLRSSFRESSSAE